MKNPKLIVKPFAKNGQKNVIPENYETSMDSNQATWDQGFGQITMLPVAAGGLPPKGQDFNGILNQISENIVYQSQGGRFKFSPEYAESIGGYPKGAILQADDEKKEYQSLIDNNKVNFNTTSNISASWELVGSKYAIKADVDLALLKKFDKENISGILGNDQSKVPSLGLLTTEVGKLQPKGNYQPAGDYATNTALNTGLAGKQPVGDYATNTALANGLGQKLNTNSVVQSTGSSTAQVMSQDASTKAFIKIGDFGVGGIAASISDSELKQGGVGRFFRQGGGSDDGTFGTWGAGYQVSYNSSISAGIFIAPSTGLAYSYVTNTGVTTRRVFYSESNTTIDSSGFLRASGSKNALTTDKVTQSIGTSKDLVMSQNAVYESLFCSNETWKNMKNERVADTNYTNSTLKPIMVSVQGNEAQVGVSVNGVTIITGKTGQDHCSFIVQPGATYSVSCRSILVWAELR
jgi:hypothetical protein